MKFLLSLMAMCLSANLAVAQEMRVFVDGRGHEVQIPVSPQRIVSLRGEQFTVPLLELGAPVVGSTGVVKDGLNGGAPTIRGAYDLFHTQFDTSGIGFVGVPKQPDIEAIAALKPDLILVPDFAADNYQQLSAVAPTVVINIWSNSARDRYRRVADAAGLLDRFEQLQATFDFRLSEARALAKTMLGDPGQVSVAIAEVRGKRFRVYKNYGAMSYILRELGFSFPPIIEEIDGDRLDLSPEQLQAIDADFLISSYAEDFGQPAQTLRANWDTLIPGWDRVLHAPRNNQHLLIAREPMRALSFRSMEEVLAVYVSNIIMRKFEPHPG